MRESSSDGNGASIMLMTPEDLRQWSGDLKDIDLSCECDTDGSKCSTWTGSMFGACCLGLRTAAIRHLGIFTAHGCSVSAVKKRLDTLADFVDLIHEVTFLPKCKHSIPENGVIRCTKPNCQYSPGPCSKRCTENVT